MDFSVSVIYQHRHAIISATTLHVHIYIFAVFTKTSIGKPWERNVFYITIIALSHAKTHNIKLRQRNHDSLQSDLISASS